MIIITCGCTRLRVQGTSCVLHRISAYACSAIVPCVLAAAVQCAHADIEVGRGVFLCSNGVEFVVPALVPKLIYEQVKAVAPISEQAIANFLAWVHSADYGGRTGVEAADDYCRAWGGRLARGISFVAETMSEESHRRSDG
jgi:hypothetical protein